MASYTVFTFCSFPNMPFAFRPLRSNEYPAGLYDRITMLCGFFLVVLLLNYPSDYQLIFLNPKRHRQTALLVLLNIQLQ